MIKINKGKAIISSIIVLLPILTGLILWNRLPDTMITHWGGDGIADGFSPKAFAVFFMPVILLVLHWLCILCTIVDKKQKDQDKKAIGILYWIVPFISLFANGIMYSAAFGRTLEFSLFIPALIGILFIFMGNYFPKIRQNRTLGIKISWTLENEENWNKTHRLAGKIWVIGGFIILLSMFLPFKLTIGVFIAVFIALIFIPVIYSYSIYKKHKKEGVIYTIVPKSKFDKIAIRISSVFVPLVLIGVAVLMFTGNIDINCGESSFKIEASYYSDLKIDYADVDSIEYREDVEIGMRTGGFGSPRLSMGSFSNTEFGAYTLYAYTGCDAHIVMEIDQKILVISGKNAEETKKIYNLLAKKIGAVA